MKRDCIDESRVNSFGQLLLSVFALHRPSGQNKFDDLLVNYNDQRKSVF